MYTKVVQKILKELDTDAQNMLRKLGPIEPTASFTAAQSKSLTDLRSGISGLQSIQIGEAKNEFDCGTKQEFERGSS